MGNLIFAFWSFGHNLLIHIFDNVPVLDEV